MALREFIIERDIRSRRLSASSPTARLPSPRRRWQARAGTCSGSEELCSRPTSLLASTWRKDEETIKEARQASGFPRPDRPKSARSIDPTTRARTGRRQPGSDIGGLASPWPTSRSRRRGSGRTRRASSASARRRDRGCVALSFGSASAAPTRLVELVDDLARRAGRRAEAGEGAGLVARQELGDRRDVGQQLEPAPGSRRAIARSLPDWMCGSAATTCRHT